MASAFSLSLVVLHNNQANRTSSLSLRARFDRLLCAPWIFQLRARVSIDCQSRSSGRAHRSLEDTFLALARADQNPIGALLFIYLLRFLLVLRLLARLVFVSAPAQTRPPPKWKQKKKTATLRALASRRRSAPAAPVNERRSPEQLTNRPLAQTGANEAPPTPPTRPIRPRLAESARLVTGGRLSSALAEAGADDWTPQRQTPQTPMPMTCGEPARRRKLLRPGNFSSRGRLLLVVGGFVPPVFASFCSSLGASAAMQTTRSHRLLLLLLLLLRRSFACFDARGDSLRPLLTFARRLVRWLPD